MKFPWNVYFPWYFLADLVIWGSIVGLLVWYLR